MLTKMIPQKPVNNKATTVIHVLHGVHIGGVESLCLQLIKHAPSNTQSILINTSIGGDMLPVFQSIENLMILNQPYDNRASKIDFVLTLSKQLRELAPHALLTYSFGLPHLLVGIAGRVARIPSIATTIQNTLPSERLMRAKWFFILCLSRLLRIPSHPCSEAVRKSLLPIYILPKSWRTISNGCDVVDIASQSEAARARQKLPSPLVIGMVARLNKIKDQKTLIEAFSLVKKKHLNTQLWLIGEGEERESLEAAVENLSLESSVLFLGKRTDVPELLGQMDIYAFSTTEDEGFGIALIEAMAACLPVVASDVAACREVLANGQAGLLIATKDESTWAATLNSLIEKENLRQYWATLAHQSVQKFDIRQTALQWYRTLLPHRVI